MKNGICLKCGSEEVYKRESVGYTYIPVTWFRTAYPTNYVCADCGYVEWFIEKPDILESIRIKWESANPKRKRKNDE